jgi:hypothetical protein
MSDMNGDPPIAPGPEAAAAAEDVADRRATDAGAAIEKPDLLAHVADVVNECFEDDPEGMKGSVE